MTPKMIALRTLDGIVIAFTLALLLSIAGLPVDRLVDLLLEGPLR